MLRKLMKYELIATGRVFLPLFAAVIILSAVNRILSSVGLMTPFTIGAVVSGMLIAAIFVMVILLTVQRFRQNLLSNEGHLMMTLPVTADSLILSKMFTASIWSVASFIVAVISIAVMASTGFSFKDIAVFFNSIAEELSVINGEGILLIIEAIVFIVLAVFSSVLMLYTCMALSMLVNKRRGLFTFGAFIVISTILQAIAGVLIAVIAASEINNGWLTRLFDGMSMAGQIQFVIVAVLLATALMCAVFYIVTRYMLKNRLNLL